jgi:hypothetical protein
VVVHAVIPTLGSSRQESCEFEASLDHVINEILSQKKKKKNLLKTVVVGPLRAKPVRYSQCIAQGKFMAVIIFII